MFVGLEFFGVYIYSCKILFPEILSLLVHLKQQGESNYKCNRCCYFDVFLHLPVRILHICFGVQIKKKKWWLVVALMEESARFLGAQVGQLFSNYIAMAGFLHFFWVPE
jgi:hypothetical protein